jgi:alpha-tubulin suppressor-like RCC1 family protein
VKRGKQILQEKQKFDFLKYFIHYEGLEDHHKELLN